MPREESGLPSARRWRLHTATDARRLMGSARCYFFVSFSLFFFIRLLLAFHSAALTSV